MAKFKIGDRVRVIKTSGYYENFKGNTGTVIEDDDVPYVQWDKANNETYHHYDNGKEYDKVKCMNEDDLIMANDLKLNDLKFGDILTVRNGERYVCGDGFMFGEKSSYYLDCDIMRDHYTDGLEHNDDEDYDIMQVEREGNIVYISEEKKEMTIEEIEKELGYSIKIVKEVA